MANRLVALSANKKVHLWVGLLLLLGMLSITPDSVIAHASLTGTTPANGAHLGTSPNEVTLEFSEPVGVVEGGTSLHMADADPVTLMPVAAGSTISIPLDTPLEDGAYIVQWRVISADSHPISGTISFTVGTASGSGDIEIDGGLPGWVEWATVMAKILGYGGMLATFGLLVVGWMLVRSDLAFVADLVRKAATIGIAGLIIEFPLAAISQRGMMVGSVGELISELRQLDTNTAWSLGAGIALLVAVALACKGDLQDRDLFAMVSIISATSLLSLLLSGHTRTKSPIWLMLVSDTVHVASGAIWLGGIIILTLGLTGRWRGESFGSTENSVGVVAGFSRLAGYTAAAVIASGVTMAIIILDSLDALLETGYGKTLLIKIGLVVIVLLLAAANRFWLLPHPLSTNKRTAIWLRRLVTAELVILVAVVGATGSLVQRDPNVVISSPQQSAPTMVFEGEAPLDSTNTVRMSVELNAGNQVTVVATIIDENRNIVLPDADLQLNWFLPEQDLGPLPQVLSIDPETGAYTGVFSLPSSGEWQLEVRANIDRFTDSRTTIDIAIPD